MVAVYALALLGRMRVQPPGQRSRDLVDSFTPPGTALAGMQQKAREWRVPPIAPLPPGRKRRPWCQKYVRERVKPGVLAARETPWVKEEVDKRPNRRFLRWAGRPGEWL